MQYKWQIINKLAQHYSENSPEIKGLNIFDAVKDEENYARIIFDHESHNLKYPTIEIEVDKNIELIYDERYAVKLPFKDYRRNPMDTIDMFGIRCYKYATIGFEKDGVKFISVINLESGIIKLVCE